MSRATGGEKTKAREVTTCHQPSGCERARHNKGDNRLNDEELSAPAMCIICRTVLCDECAAWYNNVLASKVPTERGAMAQSEFRTVGGVLCSDHYNEEWR